MAKKKAAQTPQDIAATIAAYNASPAGRQLQQSIAYGMNPMNPGVAPIYSAPPPPPSPPAPPPPAPPPPPPPPPPPVPQPVTQPAPQTPPPPPPATPLPSQQAQQALQPHLVGTPPDTSAQFQQQSGEVTPPLTTQSGQKTFLDAANQLAMMYWSALGQSPSNPQGQLAGRPGMQTPTLTPQGQRTASGYGASGYMPIGGVQATSSPTSTSIPFPPSPMPTDQGMGNFVLNPNAQQIASQGGQLLPGQNPPPGWTGPVPPPNVMQQTGKTPGASPTTTSSSTYSPLQGPTGNVGNPMGYYGQPPSAGMGLYLPSSSSVSQMGAQSQSILGSNK